MGIVTYLGLGSNVGDRAAHLRTAVTRLAENAGFARLRTSSLWESEPWGVGDQPPFLNAVVELRSQLVPPLLLEATQQIERELGRRRDGGQCCPTRIGSCRRSQAV